MGYYPSDHIRWMVDQSWCAELREIASQKSRLQMDLCLVSWFFGIIINYLRPSCTVLGGSVNVKAKKGLPDFLVTGGDVLLDPFGLEHQFRL